MLSLLEKKTENYIVFWIPGKTSEAVMAAMRMLKEEFGDRFAQVFKTIMAGISSSFSEVKLLQIQPSFPPTSVFIG